MYHCAIIFHSRHEGGPRSQAHEGRHLPFVHGDFEVGTWRGHFVHVLLFVEFAFQSGEVVNPGGVGFCALGCRCRSSEKERESEFGQNVFHNGAFVFQVLANYLLHRKDASANRNQD